MARSTTGIAYLTLGLALLGGLVFSVFVTVPAWSALRAARGHLQERTTERTQREEFLANIDARTGDLKTYERDARALGVTFPETKAPADLAAIFHALSVRNGVLIESLSEPKVRKVSVPSPTASPPAAGDDFVARPEEPGGSAPRETSPSTRAYEFSLSGRGTYAQVRAFIQDIERSLRLFDLPTVDIQGGGNLGEGGTVKVQITLTTYLAEP